VNIAAVIDSGYKLLLEMHNNPVKKKTAILCKIMNCSKFFAKLKLHLKEHEYQLKESGSSLGLLP